MASTDAQRKWRAKNRPVKRQLNVVAHVLVHDYLETIARRFGLRGKGEALSFAGFALMALGQRAAYDSRIRAALDDLREAYHRDRDLYRP